MANTKNSETAKPAKRTKVAIVGFAPSSINLAPFADQSYEVWGVNEIYMAIPRMPDRLFEIHHYRHLTQKQRNPKHLQWLQNARIPIYMVDHFADIPASVPYPREQVKEWFAKRNVNIRPYFTNTISWMLALAIMEGFERIEIWGVDMAQDTEYRHQRPSVEYWIGIGQGLGIDIYVPPQCDILACAFEYGFEEEGQQMMDAKLEARRGELQTKLNQQQQQMQLLNDDMQRTAGQLAEINVIKGRYMPVAGWSSEETPQIPQQPEALQPAKQEAGVNGVG